MESVEAVFVREGSGEEIVFLGDARKESYGDRAVRYAARLRADIAPDAAPGEYRCALLLARDRLDDDWDFVDAKTLDLVCPPGTSPAPAGGYGERIPLRGSACKRSRS